MQVGIFNCLFIFVIAALNDYVIMASIIVITIRNLINCAALTYSSIFNTIERLQSNCGLSQCMSALVAHLVKQVHVCGSDPGSNPVRSVSFSQCSNVCAQYFSDAFWIIELTGMLGVLVKGNFLCCAIIYKG